MSLKESAANWTFRIGCLGYILIGAYQFVAIADGIEYLIGLPGFICSILAIAVCEIPLISSGLALTGAIQVWEWPIIKALGFYFVLPVAFMITFGYFSQKTGLNDFSTPKASPSSSMKPSIPLFNQIYIDKAKDVLKEHLDRIEEGTLHDLDLLRRVIILTLDKNPESFLQSVREENREEEDIILAMIKNFTFKMLSEGLEGCYTYRGVLSMKGQALLDAHNYANRLLWKNGYISEELMKQDNNIMEEEIAANG